MHERTEEERNGRRREKRGEENVNGGEQVRRGVSGGGEKKIEIRMILGEDSE